jgi:hypothetical protein
MANEVNASNITTANNFHKSPICEWISALDLSEIMIPTDTRPHEVKECHPSQDHKHCDCDDLKDFVTNYVIEQKLAPLDTPWIGLYDNYPELLGSPRFTLPALQINRRAIFLQHMTVRPSVELLAKFVPVPVWEELDDDHSCCSPGRWCLVEEINILCYEDYLQDCAEWEAKARQALRKQTMDTLVTASRAIENDTSILSHFSLVPRSLRYACKGSKAAKKTEPKAAHESEDCHAKVEKWLQGVFGCHGFAMWWLWL